MTTFVLIPGMCHGGWCYVDLSAALRDHGHDAQPLTLTGVSERSHLLHSGVNLETHLQDVSAVLDAYEVRDAVLVGHSYGGMVITGVADRRPAQVGALVYVDAMVPTDGQSCWDIVSDQERQWYLDVVGTGDAVRPLPFFDPRATAHPIASLLQPIHLTGEHERIPNKHYVYAASWPGPSPFTPTYERLSDDPAWHTYAVDGQHNLMRDAPDDLLRILLDVAAQI